MILNIFTLKEVMAQIDKLILMYKFLAKRWNGNTLNDFTEHLELNGCTVCTLDI